MYKNEANSYDITFDIFNKLFEAILSKMGNKQGFQSWNSWDLNAYSQMTGLSPAQIQQLHYAFNQQTALTGGRMTLDQFRNVYTSIVGLPWNFNADAERIFLMFDTDGNGILTFDEFLMAYLLLQRNVNPVQRWSYLLNNYSFTQPGFISAPEAQLLLNDMQRVYGFPMHNSYFNTAWSQLGGGANGYVPTSSFIQTVMPLFPEAYIW